MLPSHLFHFMSIHMPDFIQFHLSMTFWQSNQSENPPLIHYLQGFGYYRHWVHFCVFCLSKYHDIKIALLFIDCFIRCTTVQECREALVFAKMLVILSSIWILIQGKLDDVMNGCVRAYMRACACV